MTTLNLIKKKKTTAPKRKQILIGVDTGTRFNSFCIVPYDFETSRADWAKAKVGLFKSIALLGACHDLITLALEDVEIYALVECPTWGGPGTREVRTAAIAWENYLRDLFHGRVRVDRVCPSVWQPVILGRVGATETTKTVADRRARSLGLHLKTSHEADAVCIAEYASLIKRGLVARPKKAHRKVSTK